MKRKLIIRYIPLGVLLLLVWMTQSIPALGNLYSQTVYPVILSLIHILKQLRKLGASCDWDRTAFTMDEERSKSVLKVFVDLYNNCLLYTSRCV